MFPFLSEERYQDGQIVFEEGGRGEGMYVIMSGSVEISKVIRGTGTVVDLLHRGDAFGGLGFLGCPERTVTARAVGETTLARVDGDAVGREFQDLSPGFRSLCVTQTQRLKRVIDIACESSHRAAPRVPKTLAVTYRLSESIVKAYAVDISAGGLFIKTVTPLGEGEEFLLQLQLPGLPEPLGIRCQVAWAKMEAREGDRDARPAGMGIKFLDITEEDREILKPYIRAIEKTAIPAAEMTEKDNRILKQFLETVEKGRHPSP
jgi:uncharacterized protein (TIGR02266 family)